MSYVYQLRESMNYGHVIVGNDVFAKTHENKFTYLKLLIFNLLSRLLYPF